MNLKKQVCSFVRPMEPTVSFDIANIMPQTNQYDCGLFAIANATALLHGHSPAKCVWDMDKMREHLIQAFKKKKLDQFPIIKERRVPFGGAIKHSEVVDIYCDCRMPYDGSSGGDMIQCSMCKNWFHCTCVNLSSVANYKNKKWYCVKCNVLMS